MQINTEPPHLPSPGNSRKEFIIHRVLVLDVNSAGKIGKKRAFLLLLVILVTFL